MAEPSRDSRPIPDPTLLTTQQLLREMANLKEVISTRLDGMDRAIVIFNENLTRAPTEVDKQISHLKELHNEKFVGVHRQFCERDERIKQTAVDSKEAIAAALQAAKEAVGKQQESSDRANAKAEAAFTKQMDQQAQTMRAEINSLNDKIDSIKERVTANEGRSMGTQETKEGTRLTTGTVLAVAGFFLAVIVAAVGWMTRH